MMLMIISILILHIKILLSITKVQIAIWQISSAVLGNWQTFFGWSCDTHIIVTRVALIHVILLGMMLITFVFY